MRPARSWDKGFPEGGCFLGKPFYSVLSPEQFWGAHHVPHPYGILRAVPKDKAGDMLPSSLAPPLPRGSTPCVTQLTTARRKNNDLH